MKYLIIILLLSGCSNPGVISGTPANVSLKGYTEMCIREPESELCREKDL